MCQTAEIDFCRQTSVSSHHHVPAISTGSKNISRSTSSIVIQLQTCRPGNISTHRKSATFNTDFRSARAVTQRNVQYCNACPCSPSKTDDRPVLARHSIVLQVGALHAVTPSIRSRRIASTPTHTVSQPSTGKDGCTRKQTVIRVGNPRLPRKVKAGCRSNFFQTNLS